MLLLLACMNPLATEAPLHERAATDPSLVVAPPLVAVVPAPAEPDPCDPVRPFPGDLTLSTSELAAAFCGSFNAVGGSLTIADTDWTDVSAVACLCDVGRDLVIRDIPALSSLAGLERLGAVAGRLTLANLDSLTEVDLPGLVRVGGRLSVEPNPDLVAVRGPELVYVGSLSVQYAPRLATVLFPSLTHIQKDLALYGSDALDDLTGFPALMRVGGVVYLDQMNGLTSLRGLERLHEVGSLEIVDADLLTSVAGPRLTTVPGILLLDGNGSLVSLDALSTLTRIGTLDVRDNDTLTEIQPLAGIDAVTGDFIVTHNDRLPSSAAWDIVAEIGEENIAGSVTIQ